jgi:hypothetical protein
MHYRKADFTFTGHDPYKVFDGEKLLVNCVEANDIEGWAECAAEHSVPWGKSYTSYKRHFGKIYIVRFEGYDELDKKEVIITDT